MQGKFHYDLNLEGSKFLRKLRVEVTYFESPSSEQHECFFGPVESLTDNTWQEYEAGFLTEDLKDEWENNKDFREEIDELVRQDLYGNQTPTLGEILREMEEGPQGEVKKAAA